MKTCFSSLEQYFNRQWIVNSNPFFHPDSKCAYEYSVLCHHFHFVTIFILSRWSACFENAVLGSNPTPQHFQYTATTVVSFRNVGAANRCLVNRLQFPIIDHNLMLKPDLTRDSLLSKLNLNNRACYFHEYQIFP